MTVIDEYNIETASYDINELARLAIREFNEAFTKITPHETYQNQSQEVRTLLARVGWAISDIGCSEDEMDPELSSHIYGDETLGILERVNGVRSSTPIDKIFNGYSAATLHS